MLSIKPTRVYRVSSQIFKDSELGTADIDVDGEPSKSLETTQKFINTSKVGCVTPFNQYKNLFS